MQRSDLAGMELEDLSCIMDQAKQDIESNAKELSELLEVAQALQALNKITQEQFADIRMENMIVSQLCRDFNIQIPLEVQSALEAASGASSSAGRSIEDGRTQQDWEAVEKTIGLLSRQGALQDESLVKNVIDQWVAMRQVNGACEPLWQSLLVASRLEEQLPAQKAEKKSIPSEWNILD